MRCFGCGALFPASKTRRVFFSVWLCADGSWKRCRHTSPAWGKVWLDASGLWYRSALQDPLGGHHPLTVPILPPLVCLFTRGRILGVQRSPLPISRSTAPMRLQFAPAAVITAPPAAGQLGGTLTPALASTGKGPASMRTLDTLCLHVKHRQPNLSAVGAADGLPWLVQHPAVVLAHGGA
jgi:hypothetical protein